jgi:hypothetical protein
MKGLPFALRSKQPPPYFLVSFLPFHLPINYRGDLVRSRKLPNHNYSRYKSCRQYKPTVMSFGKPFNNANTQKCTQCDRRNAQKCNEHGFDMNILPSPNLQGHFRYVDHEEKPCAGTNIYLLGEL